MNGSELFLNYGALGIIAGLAVVFVKQTVDRLTREKDTALSQRDALVQDVFTKVTPAIEGAIKVMERRQTMDDEIMDLMVDLRRLLERT